MGSSLSQQLCCVPCERCREQEAANTEPSETKPILQSPRTFLHTQPPSPALKVPTQGSKELGQHHQPSADALEENGEPCSAAEGWEAAWNPMDFFLGPADEEVGGEDSTQQMKVDKTEEEIKGVPVGDTALGAELVAEEEQPGPEGAPCAGITLQQGNLTLTEPQSEAEPGQGCETEPPAEPKGILLGSDLVLCAMEVAGQPEPLEGAEKSPQPTQRAELTCLVEAMSLLTLQSPSEAIARGVAELCSASPVCWEPLCPQWGSLEPPNHLLQLLKKGLDGTVSPPAQGLQGTVSPPAQSLQGAVSPPVQGLDGTVSPVQGLDGTVSPVQGTVSPPAQSLQGTVSPPAQGRVSLAQGLSPAQGLDVTVSPAQGMNGNVSPAQDTQGTVSPAGPSEILQQPQDGALCGLGGRGCTPGPEEEPQHRITQPTLEFPEEPAVFVAVPVKQGAQFPHVSPSLPEGLGSSGETEAENAEA